MEMAKDAFLKLPKLQWILNITAIEYFIWGIIDPFYGLFVFEVVNDYGLVGLMFGLRTIITLVSIFLFDRIFKVFTPVQNLFLANIFMVLFSIALFFAGYFQSVFLLFVMTALYGVIFAMKTSSKQIMLRQSVPAEQSTELLSKNITLKYEAWIFGMIVGGGIMLLWDGIPLSFLFLSIAGLWVFSLFPFFTEQKEIMKMREHALHPIHSFVFPSFSLEKVKSYFFSFPLILRYNFSLFSFSEFLGRVTLLFVPILGQSLNLHLSEIFWLTAFMISPMVFTQVFAFFVKIFNKLVIIIGSIALSLFPLFYLSFTEVPWWIGMCSFIISLSLAMLQPAIIGMSQKYTPSIRIQETTQMEIFFGNLGGLLGSIGIGYIAKIWSIEIAFGMSAFVAFVFLLISIGMKITAPSSLPINTISEDEKNEKKSIEHTHFHFRRHFG